MEFHLQLTLSIVLSSFILSIFPCTIQSKSTIEPCISPDSCTALLSYVVPYDSLLSEIAFRFRVNISDILSANNINPTPSPSPSPSSLISNHIFHANSLLKIPVSCPCVDGIRRSMSTNYTVRTADTLDSISEAYGRLVSGEQIRNANGINATKHLTSGDTLEIPLPCTCFNNVNNGAPAVFMSYAVQKGESLSGIAMEFGTTVMNLEAVNGLGLPDVDPGDILAIPISACSSANLNWYNESLIVPSGSYALTANNCIKCICGSANLNLHCVPSGLEVSCSHLQCKGSDLFIGDANAVHTAIGCDVRACVYRGHYGRKIFRSLMNYSHVRCRGNQIYDAMPPSVQSPSFNPLVPSIEFPPILSPSSSAPYPMDRRNYSNVPNEGESHDVASCYSCLLFEVVFFLIALVV